MTAGLRCCGLLFFAAVFVKPQELSTTLRITVTLVLVDDTAIRDEMRSQYGIGYVSTNTAKDGSYRKLEVKIAKGFKVQTRTGYYAARK
jgi:hypothetical protein